MARCPAARRHDARRLVGQGQQRIALGTGKKSTPLLADEEHHKGANQ
jgi:hypothetical protein